MIKKIILTVLLVSMVAILFAQAKQDDIIKTNYKQKSAKMAMMLSAVFPGAGQFYANKKSVTAYIFPAIEVGLWYGYLHYRNKGNQIE